MSLRAQAKLDAESIVRNTSDFGYDVTLTDPAGATTPLVGLTGDISTVIDPDTGTAVKGRRIHTTLAIADLPAGARPKAQNDDTLKPWLITFKNLVSQVDTTFAIVASDPDDTLGLINFELAVYT